MRMFLVCDKYFQIRQKPAVAVALNRTCAKQRKVLLYKALPRIIENAIGQPHADMQVD